MSSAVRMGPVQALSICRCHTSQDIAAIGRVSSCTGMRYPVLRCENEHPDGWPFWNRTTLPARLTYRSIDIPTLHVKRTQTHSPRHKGNNCTMLIDRLSAGFRTQAEAPHSQTVFSLTSSFRPSDSIVFRVVCDSSAHVRRNHSRSDRSNRPIGSGTHLLRPRCSPNLMNKLPFGVSGMKYLGQRTSSNPFRFLNSASEL